MTGRGVALKVKMGHIKESNAIEMWWSNLIK